VTDSKLLQKLPAFTEPKTEIKCRVQNIQETRDEGVGDGYGMLRVEAQRAEGKSAIIKGSRLSPFPFSLHGARHLKRVRHQSVD
jgi:hypothetical protein